MQELRGSVLTNCNSTDLIKSGEPRSQRVVPPNVRTNILEKIPKLVTNVLKHDIFPSPANILTECVTKQEKNVRTNKNVLFFEEWSNNSDWIKIFRMECNALKNFDLSNRSSMCVKDMMKAFVLRSGVTAEMSSRFFCNLIGDSSGELTAVRIFLNS